MKPTQSLVRLFIRLWGHTSFQRRWQLFALLMLMVLASFAEILSIGAVIPFLGILTSPSSVFNHPIATIFNDYFGVSSAEQVVLPLTIIFCVAALFAGMTRLLMLWASTRLAYAIGADLGVGIYRRTLYQPYAVHIGRNSSEIISGISMKARGVVGVVMMVLNFLGSSIMVISISLALISVEPNITLTAFGGFALIYCLIAIVTRRRLLINSQHSAHESNAVMKNLQEGLGGIRDVLIDGSQEVFCRSYREADLRLRRAQSSISFTSISPRYVMESLGMVFLAVLAYVLMQQKDGAANAIPVLGALALGAQRMLPVLQQMFNAWSNVKGGQASFQDTLDLLDQSLPDYAGRPPAEQLPFRQQISFKHVSFRFSPQLPWVLEKLDLNIPKGSRVGFIGTTGGGKSTLLDIVMGLLQPTEGSLYVDGQSVATANCRGWQAHIAHVPQSIFLTDSTIEENIAFGIPRIEIDHERVKQAARQAQIADSIETWPKQYQTIVGERGIRLSGGQRQRIGIARALYKQADVIIFDEATSALDNETEQDVMQAIESLSKDLTLLIVAHRLTTLKNCTQIVELEGGGIKRIGSYQDIVNQVATTS